MGDLVRGLAGTLATLMLGLGLVAASAGAQAPYATDPLLRGHLVVWVVRPGVTHRTPDPAVHEQTVGNFGQDAGNVGQTAGSYGQSAGSLGDSAALASHPAGRVGQSVGSFGHSLGTIADAGKSPPPEPEFEPAQLGSQWDGVLSSLHAQFHGLGATLLPVSATDLQERLQWAQATDVYPDVLIGTEAMPMGGGEPFLTQAAFSSLGPALSSAEWPSQDQRWPPSHAELMILRRAPHPLQARAFVVWLRDGMRARRERHDLAHTLEVPVGTAAEAARALLLGAPVPAADPAFAPVQPPAASQLALWAPSREALDGLQIRMDVLDAAANERFAVIALRAIAASNSGFGVLHPFVVLRREPHRSWRVLQVTTTLPIDQQTEAFRELQTYARPVPPAGVTTPVGVTQAAPVDGDSRAGTPELWWDNGGGDSLLAVEWQTRAEGGWSDSHLFFIPDRGSRLQVRVTASFAYPTHQYHWRVWSLGSGGSLALSPWRRLTVLP